MNGPAVSSTIALVVNIEVSIFDNSIIVYVLLTPIRFLGRAACL